MSKISGVWSSPAALEERHLTLGNALLALDNASSVRMGVGPFGTPVVIITEHADSFEAARSMIRAHLETEIAEVEAAMAKLKSAA